MSNNDFYGPSDETGAGQPPTWGTYPGTGYGYQPAPPTDGLGIAALIVGIASLVFACAYGVTLLGSPAALIMGKISMNRIDRSGGTLSGRGLALAGFVLGIVGTVLLVLFIALIVTIVVIGINGGFDSSY